MRLASRKRKLKFIGTSDYASQNGRLSRRSFFAYVALPCKYRPKEWQSFITERRRLMPGSASALPQRQKKNGGHDPAIVKEWAGIVSDCRALLPIRNHLAHWPIVKGVHLELSKEKSGQTVRILSKKEMIEISMGLAEIHRGNDGKDPIKPTDLPGYHRRVAVIRKALMSFYQKISATPPQ